MTDLARAFGDIVESQSIWSSLAWFLMVSDEGGRGTITIRSTVDTPFGGVEMDYWERRGGTVSSCPCGSGSCYLNSRGGCWDCDTKQGLRTWVRGFLDAVETEASFEVGRRRLRGHLIEMGLRCEMEHVVESIHEYAGGRGASNKNGRRLRVHRTSPMSIRYIDDGWDRRVGFEAYCATNGRRPDSFVSLKQLFLLEKLIRLRHHGDTPPA